MCHIKLSSEVEITKIKTLDQQSKESFTITPVFLLTREAICSFSSIDLKTILLVLLRKAFYHKNL